MLRFRLLKYDTCDDEAERARIIDDLLKNQLSTFQIDHQAPAGAPGEDEEVPDSSVFEDKYPELWRPPLQASIDLVNSSNKMQSIIDKNKGMMEALGREDLLLDPAS